MLARRLHLPDAVALALGQLIERWDGKGCRDAAGEEISRPLRIVRVAHDLVAIARRATVEAAIDALSRRRGPRLRPGDRRRRSRRAELLLARRSSPTPGSG